MTIPSIRFLADESCDFAVVRALRAQGYDVLAVSEIMTRSVDRELNELPEAFVVVQPGHIRISGRTNL